MGWIEWLTVIGFLITAISLIMQIWKEIPTKYAKKFYYFLFNKKIKIKIKSIKKYPELKIDLVDTNKLKKVIEGDFKDKTLVLEGFQIVGSNYLELYFKNTQAPYFIQFQPIISYEGEKTIEEGIEIIIELKGIIEFFYREDMDNLKYLEIIEDLFDIIEKEYEIKPIYVDHMFKSTLSDFQENWDTLKTKESDGIKISIGKKVLDIHSKKISPIYRSYKKNISSI